MIAEAALDCDAAATKQARAALRALLAGGDAPQGAWAGLSIFAPVAAYKSRHDCVLLPFDALERALSETVNPQ
ncbi:MAG: hypothetical protein HY057_02255 [Rhodospirillales bacterium]|nr:hypothetical protein [Rhodospirillales bacterium]